MKVLFILSGLGAGGTEMLALDVARNSLKTDFDVSIVYSKSAELEDQFLASGVPVYKIKRKYPFDLKYLRDLYRFLKKNKFDIIHAHEPLVNIYACITKNKKSRNFLTIHGYDASWKSRLLIQLSIFLGTRIVVVSNGFKEILSKHFKTRANNFQVVYNGIDFSKFQQDKGNLIHELNIPDDAILFGMVGAFAQRKDQLTLCKAFHLISQKYNNVYLAFAGPQDKKHPEFLDDCVTFCQENYVKNVFFLGGRDDINNILNSLDVFVLSSNRDTFGIALIEAMYMGKPCIASDIPPFVEISENGEYVSLFKKGDETDLADKISAFIEMPEKRKNFAVQGQNRALDFSIQKYIEELKRVYNQT